MHYRQLACAALAGCLVGAHANLRAGNPTPRHQAGRPTAPAAGLTPAAVQADMKRVADWQLAHPTKAPLNGWEYGPFYQGLMKLYALSGDKKYLNATLRMGEAAKWEPQPRPYDANSLAVVPAFADVYDVTHDAKVLDKSRYMLDMTMARNWYQPSFKPEVGFDNNKYWYEWWTWCDALFMAPPAYARLAAITKNNQYQEFMVKRWWLTSDYLYSKPDSLFFRDDRFFSRRSKNGRKVFWARGNGWVIGGLCGVLNYLPANHPDRPRFEQQLKELCARLVPLQMPNGCWSQSLLDAQEFPQKETSGTAFFAYGLAWGINHGLLPKDRYYPVLLRAWPALVAAIHPDGKLGYVQLVGDAPDRVDAEDTESYGAGTFLLAGCEMAKLLN